MTQAGALPRRGRHHLVLVPGFGGFDALGQIPYYAATSGVFQQWKQDNNDNNNSNSSNSNNNDSKSMDAEIHYFDNFPTASVKTRAMKLRFYLAGMMARGDIQDYDTVSLIGHSTGGLDIRQLLKDLKELTMKVESRFVEIDVNCWVSYEVLLRKIQNVVFISVPQLGTNLADWVYQHWIVCRSSIRTLNLLYQFSFLPLVKPFFWGATKMMEVLLKWDLLYALHDTFDEANPNGVCDPAVAAVYRENDAELKLFLEQMAKDFSAIYDLRAETAFKATPAELEQEKELWESYQIKTRSYATIGHRIFDIQESDNDSSSLGLIEVLSQSVCNTGGETDGPYRCGYRACSSGPFRKVYDRYQLGLLQPKFENGRKCKIEPWDADGIVNTASMLWPNGEETILVEGDHGDIIGHYKRIEDNERNRENTARRRHQRYDLLRSDSGFDQQRFKKVWRDVFEFCLSNIQLSPEAVAPTDEERNEARRRALINP